MPSTPPVTIDHTFAGDNPVNGAELDQVFADIAATLNRLITQDNAKVVRDDDTLADKTVRLRMLHPEVGAHYAQRNGLPVVGGFSWKQPVLRIENNPPGEEPQAGDRYLVGESPTGAWAGLAGHIVQWAVIGGVGQWISEGEPQDGWYVYVLDQQAPYGRSGGAWLENGGARGFGVFVGEYSGSTSGVPGAGQNINLNNGGDARSARGVGLSLAIGSAALAGVVTVRVFQDSLRTQLVAELVADLADNTTWATRDAFGFEAATDLQLWATVYSAGMASGAVTVTVRAHLLLVENYNPLLYQDLGNGLMQAGDGKAQVKLAGVSGLAVDSGGLRVVGDPAGAVRVIPQAGGLAVTGALATTTDQDATGQKRMAGLGCVPRGTLGPPTSGTWLAGVEVADSEGVRWRCRVGGTPGQWELADTVTRWTSRVVGAVLPPGATTTVLLPVDGQAGSALVLRVDAAATAFSTGVAPLRVRVYPSTGLLGRDLLWQGLALARFTYLTAAAIPSAGSLTVADNNIGEIDDLLLAGGYYARVSGRTGGDFQIDEPMTNPGTIPLNTIVRIVSEFQSVPFLCEDSADRHLIVQIRNDSATVTVEPAVQALMQCRGVLR